MLKFPYKTTLITFETAILNSKDSTVTMAFSKTFKPKFEIPAWRHTKEDGSVVVIDAPPLNGPFLPSAAYKIRAAKEKGKTRNESLETLKRMMRRNFLRRTMNRKASERSASAFRIKKEEAHSIAKRISAIPGDEEKLTPNYADISHILGSLKSNEKKHSYSQEPRDADYFGGYVGYMSKSP